MRMKMVVVAALLISSTLVLNVNALDRDEKETFENIATGLLMKSEVLDYARVEIDSQNNMDIWFVAAETNEVAITQAIGACAGVYTAGCKIYPEMSDLRLMLGHKGNVAGEMYCKRDWVDSVGDNPAVQTAFLQMIIGTFRVT